MNCDLIVIYFFEELHHNPRVGLDLVINVQSLITGATDCEWEQSLLTFLGKISVVIDLPTLTVYEYPF